MFFASEVFFWQKINNRYDIHLPFFKTSLRDYISDYPPGRFVEFNKKYEEKKPILLLGCSYAYGEFIDINDNFASKLTELTNRWVYNFGEAGQGPIHSLVLLNMEKEKPLIKEKPEYVIYLYMFHHINRYYFQQYYHYYRNANWVPFQKTNIFDRFYTYQYFRNIEIDNYFSDDENYEKRLELFFKIVRDMKQKSDNLFPNSRFIILIYSDVNKDLCEGLWGSVNNSEYQMNKLFEIMNSESFRQKLKSEGIEVISTEELIGRKMYKNSDRAVNDPHHPHPSSSAWDEILPQLAKRLNL